MSALSLCALPSVGLPSTPKYKMAPSWVSATSIYVKKSTRQMFLMHKDLVIKIYTVQLGHNPIGHKRYKGDGRTPEGVYRITHRNPQSAFHLSLGVSYPNATDRSVARRNNWNPGGDIFIHGRGPKSRPGRDWTAGCIAVEDWEMDEIWKKVKPGTRIKIVA